MTDEPTIFDILYAMGATCPPGQLITYAQIQLQYGGEHAPQYVLPAFRTGWRRVMDTYTEKEWKSWIPFFAAEATKLASVLILDAMAQLSNLSYAELRNLVKTEDLDADARRFFDSQWAEWRLGNTVDSAPLGDYVRAGELIIPSRENWRLIVHLHDLVAWANIPTTDIDALIAVHWQTLYPQLSPREFQELLRDYADYTEGSWILDMYYPSVPDEDKARFLNRVTKDSSDAVRQWAEDRLADLMAGKPG